MPLFVEKYTPQQKDAMAIAYEDRRVRPARLVVELAAAGELTYNGEKLAPFETNEDTVRSEARDLRKRRHGHKTSQLSQLPHRDAIEKLRIRFVNMIDAELEHLEKQKAGARDPEKMRQVARAMREVAALPGPTDPRPAAPGARRDGERNGAETKGGMAGKLIADHRAGGPSTNTAAEGEPAADATPPQPTNHGDSTTPASASAASNDNSDQPHDAPGSRAAQLIEASPVLG